jgi:hypothetical protein
MAGQRRAPQPPPELALDADLIGGVDAGLRAHPNEEDGGEKNQ